MSERRALRLNLKYEKTKLRKLRNGTRKLLHKLPSRPEVEPGGGEGRWGAHSAEPGEIGDHSRSEMVMPLMVTV